MKGNTLHRRKEIIDIVNEKGQTSVSYISERYKVSEVSIRNDLKHLEKKGLLVRTRGGALKKQLSTFDYNLNQRLNTNLSEKQRIGLKATEFIQNGNTIVMDSGSTTIELAKNLKIFKGLKIITNSLPIADIVADFNDIEVVIIGGILRKEMRSLVGPVAESNLLNYNCDVAFIGADGICHDYGITTPVLYEAALSRTMIKIAKKIIVVSDSSKFGKRSFAKITDIASIDIIITDKKLPSFEEDKFKKSDLSIVKV